MADTALSSAAARPPSPSSNVLCLPCADAPPVVQQRRRGPNPKSVAPLWKTRNAASRFARQLRLKAQIDCLTLAMAENVDTFQQDHEAMCEIKQRLVSSSAVFSELKSRKDALVAELGALS